jgi:PIN domain nuclease of toxin-antitoxin system
LPFTVEIAIESEQLPDAFPRDPADRPIAATARVYDLTLLTADAAMRPTSELRTLW